MKKAFALLLALLVLLGAVSCGSGGQIPLPPSQETIELPVVSEEPAAPAASQSAEPAESAAAESAEPEASPEEPELPSELPDTGVTTEEVPFEADEPAAPDEPEASPIDEDGVYTSKDDVALYLYTYGHLPQNFITKNEARDLGWSGGGLEPYAPGCCIGGDRFGNYEGILPKGTYHECDIDTLGASSRGSKRIVWSDTAIYYTDDHYNTFTKLY